MIRGLLVAESLRTGARLPCQGLGWITRDLRRVTPPQIAPGQPSCWTILEFEVPESQAGSLAQALAGALDGPGWYVDFHSASESFVVFPGRIFRYPRGSRPGRAEAVAHARSLGIPESQLDWES